MVAPLPATRTHPRGEKFPDGGARTPLPSRSKNPRLAGAFRTRMRLPCASSPISLNDEGEALRKGCIDCRARATTGATTRHGRKSVLAPSVEYAYARRRAGRVSGRACRCRAGQTGSRCSREVFWSSRKPTNAAQSVHVSVVAPGCCAVPLSRRRGLPTIMLAGIAASVEARCLSIRRSCGTQTRG